MNCQDVFVRLSADVDGELPAGEASEVRRHLTSCVECARKRALLDQTRRAFQVVEVQPARQAHARALWLSGAVAMALLIGFALFSKPSFTPSEGPRVIQPRPGISAEQLSSVLPDSRAGADCGLSGSVVCVVEAPCRSGQCSPDAMLADLR